MTPFAGATVNLNINIKPADPVVVQKVYTPVTVAFKTNNVNVFVNTVVVIKSVKECDAFVQAIVYVVNSGASSSIVAPFGQNTFWGPYTRPNIRSCGKKIYGIWSKNGIFWPKTPNMRPNIHRMPNGRICMVQLSPHPSVFVVPVPHEKHCSTLTKCM